MRHSASRPHATELTSESEEDPSESSLIFFFEMASEAAFWALAFIWAELPLVLLRSWSNFRRRPSSSTASSALRGAYAVPFISSRY